MKHYGTKSEKLVKEGVYQLADWFPLTGTECVKQYVLVDFTEHSTVSTGYCSRTNNFGFVSKNEDDTHEELLEKAYEEGSLFYRKCGL